MEGAPPEVVLDNSNWKENWLFRGQEQNAPSKRRYVDTITMLIPHPTTNIGPTIGDRDVDEMSELSDRRSVCSLGGITEDEMIRKEDELAADYCQQDLEYTEAIATAHRRHLPHYCDPVPRPRKCFLNANLHESDSHYRAMDIVQNGVTSRFSTPSLHPPKDASRMFTTNCTLSNNVWFETYPQNQRVFAGRTLRISCQVQARNNFGVSWYYANELLNDGPNILTWRKRDAYYLNIFDFSEANAGVYVVCAYTHDDCIWAKCDVVCINQHRSKKTPRFTLALSDVTAEAGSDVILQCQVAGHPEPKVTFLRNSMPLFPLIDHCIIENDQYGTWSLRLREIKVSSGGLISALACNSLGQTMSVCRVTVIPEGSCIEVQPRDARSLDSKTTSLQSICMSDANRISHLPLEFDLKAQSPLPYRSYYYNKQYNRNFVNGTASDLNDIEAERSNACLCPPSKSGTMDSNSGSLTMHANDNYTPVYKSYKPFFSSNKNIYTHEQNNKSISSSLTLPVKQTHTTQHKTSNIQTYRNKFYMPLSQTLSHSETCLAPRPYRKQTNIHTSLGDSLTSIPASYEHNAADLVKDVREAEYSLRSLTMSATSPRPLALTEPALSGPPVLTHVTSSSTPVTDSVTFLSTTLMGMPTFLNHSKVDRTKSEPKIKKQDKPKFNYRSFHLNQSDEKSTGKSQKVKRYLEALSEMNIYQKTPLVGLPEMVLDSNDSFQFDRKTATNDVASTFSKNDGATSAASSDLTYKSMNFMGIPTYSKTSKQTSNSTTESVISTSVTKDTISRPSRPPPSGSPPVYIGMSLMGTPTFSKAPKHTYASLSELRNVGIEHTNKDDAAPLPGSIAEREHRKWSEAKPVANNPYAPDKLERRLGQNQRYPSMPTVYREAVLCDEDAMMASTKDLGRYARDYHIPYHGQLDKGYQSTLLQSVANDEAVSSYDQQNDSTFLVKIESTKIDDWKEELKNINLNVGQKVADIQRNIDTLHYEWQLRLEQKGWCPYSYTHNFFAADSLRKMKIANPKMTSSCMNLSTPSKSKNIESSGGKRHVIYCSTEALNAVGPKARNSNAVWRTGSVDALQSRHDLEQPRPLGEPSAAAAETIRIGMSDSEESTCLNVTNGFSPHSEQNQYYSENSYDSTKETDTENFVENANTTVKQLVSRFNSLDNITGRMEPKQTKIIRSPRKKDISITQDKSTISTDASQKKYNVRQTNDKISANEVRFDDNTTRQCVSNTKNESSTNLPACNVSCLQTKVKRSTPPIPAERKHFSTNACSTENVTSSKYACLIENTDTTKQKSTEIEKCKVNDSEPPVLFEKCYVKDSSEESKALLKGASSFDNLSTTSRCTRNVKKEKDEFASISSGLPEEYAIASSCDIFSATEKERELLSCKDLQGHHHKNVFSDSNLDQSTEYYGTEVPHGLRKIKAVGLSACSIPDCNSSYLTVAVEPELAKQEETSTTKPTKNEVENQNTKTSEEKEASINSNKFENLREHYENLESQTDRYQAAIEEKERNKLASVKAEKTTKTDNGNNSKNKTEKNNSNEITKSNGDTTKPKYGIQEKRPHGFYVLNNFKCSYVDLDRVYCAKDPSEGGDTDVDRNKYNERKKERRHLHKRIKHHHQDHPDQYNVPFINSRTGSYDMGRV